MGKPLSMGLRERAMSRVESGETMKSIAAALGSAVLASQNGRRGRKRPEA